jgi:chromosome partitioning protein
VSVLAVANQKGGVGKTTTAVNLSAALGVLDQKVLMIDCDPQGNATRGLGVDPEVPLLYDALVGRCTLEDAIRQTDFAGLDVVPSNRDLVGVEVEMVGVDGWETRLKDLLSPIRSYDTIILDCPPSLGHLTVGALVAADAVLIPMQCEYFALEGMAELISTVRRVRESLNPNLEVAGIVLTMFDERTNLAREVRDEIRRHFPDLLYETAVPRNIRLAEAQSFGLPALHYDVKSTGAQAYLDVAREFLRKVA